MCDIKALTSVSELRGFLGICTYSQQFIENYREIARPLTELIHKDKPFEWGELQEQSFHRMKEKLFCAFFGLPRQGQRVSLPNLRSRQGW